MTFTDMLSILGTIGMTGSVIIARARELRAMKLATEGYMLATTMRAEAEKAHRELARVQQQEIPT